MDTARIELAARQIHVEIWRQRASLWPDGQPPALYMIEPEVAAQVLGVSYEFHEDLGRFGLRGRQFEIAGLLNRERRQIAVANRFPNETIRFTGAHEIGHWLLHPNEVMHRDRPIKGLSGESFIRNDVEREADHFAACLLMPAKLMRTQFEATFDLKAPFVFDDAAAHWLSPDEPEALLRPYHGSRARALALASAESFQGRHFLSLARQFRVSVPSMAIRIEELELVQDWP